MAKLPYMQFYPSDYIQDTQVLGLAEQGAWMRLLCAMWIAPRRGQLDWTFEIFARYLGLAHSPADALSVFETLCNAHVGEFVLDEKTQRVTIMSRRMIREERERIQGRERVKRYRNGNVTPIEQGKKNLASDPCNANVTPHISEVRSQKSERKKERKSASNGNAPADYWTRKLSGKPQEPVERPMLDDPPKK